MLTAISTQERLTSAAETAGLKRTRKGLFGPGQGKADWKLAMGPFGAVSLTRPHSLGENQRLLIEHSAWSGPVKLQKSGDGTLARIDLFFGSLLSEQHGLLLDEEELDRAQGLLSDVLGRVPEYFNGREQIDGWQPPAARLLSEWLNEAGHEAAIDKDDNLRLAVKRRGCDGQIRVNRQPGRLRFTMPLGQWEQLEPAAEAAVLALAEEANARSRLVRIAWIEDEAARRCEAQVDLAGLPIRDPASGLQEALWKEMVRAALDGLELALRRLGLELNALAEKKNEDFAALLVAGE